MKTVIAGLEEGLNAIAEALEGGGGGGGSVPTPTLDDEGKVLKAVPQTQTTVAPEWATIRELPIGGSAGQVLTRSHEGYEWETPNELPALYDEDTGKVLMAQYDSDTENTYPAWGIVKGVPNSNASDSGKVLTCTGRNAYGWAPASSGGGGGHIDVVKFDIAKAQFNQDGDMYKVYASTEDPDIATKINNIISMSIVDNVDEGSPDLINPATGEFSIYYEDELVTIKISSTIYNKLGNRGNNHFYMTYYTGV